MRKHCENMRKFLYLAILLAIIIFMQVSVAEAKNKLPELIKAVENGETITITRHGRPVVDLVRSQQASGRKRELGTLRGKIQINDPDWWKPMTEEELEKEGWLDPIGGL